jgi:predicted enzyme related to lactoylglutathione lyase
MSNRVVHFEFWTEDQVRCRTFYERAFGWNVRPIPEIDYTLVESAGEGGIGGGIMTPKAGPWPAKLALYIDVDDLAATRTKIIEAGGKLLVEQQDVPGVGSFCLFEDPDGRVLGCWKQLPKP